MKIVVSTLGSLALLVGVIAVLVVMSAEGRPVTPAQLSSYQSQRDGLIASEVKMRIGGTTTLNAAEKLLSDFIMKEKRQVMEEAILNRTTYYPALSFYRSKPWIEQTNTFKIIKDMPKGAALHLHDLAIASLDWLVKNATYRDNVYMCVDSGYFVQLGHFFTVPSSSDCQWQLVKTKRQDSGNADEFDRSLKQNISMLTTDPLIEYPSVTSVWDRFNKYFSQVIQLLFHEPIMRDYYRQALKEFKEDNVMYVEVRTQMTGFTDANGTVRDTEFGCNMYKEITDEFVNDNKDFFGAKVIMSGLRYKPKDAIMKEVETAMMLHKKYPDFMMGYDLVGQEDPNHPLTFYLDELLYPSRQDPPYHLPYFYHAGETKWQGTDVDYNLVDALLLNATRIGHGYALPKHPKLAEMVKSKGIAVEVNPLSNQLLGLVDDIRNHPMVNLMADNFPIVVSSDDPSTWESAPLSHDIYVAFMAMSGEDADLSFLKQLAINSLEYSVMNPTEKQAAKALWQTKWDKFINDAILNYLGTTPPTTSATTTTTTTTATDPGSNTGMTNHSTLWKTMLLPILAALYHRLH